MFYHAIILKLMYQIDVLLNWVYLWVHSMDIHFLDSMKTQFHLEIGCVITLLGVLLPLHLNLTLLGYGGFKA